MSSHQGMNPSTAELDDTQAQAPRSSLPVGLYGICYWCQWPYHDIRVAPHPDHQMCFGQDYPVDLRPQALGGEAPICPSLIDTLALDTPLWTNFQRDSNKPNVSSQNNITVAGALVNPNRSAGNPNLSLLESESYPIDSSHNPSLLDAAFSRTGVLSRELPIWDVGTANIPQDTFAPRNDYSAALEGFSPYTDNVASAGRPHYDRWMADPLPTLFPDRKTSIPHAILLRQGTSTERDISIYNHTPLDSGSEPADIALPLPLGVRIRDIPLGNVRFPVARSFTAMRMPVPGPRYRRHKPRWAPDGPMSIQRLFPSMPGTLWVEEFSCEWSGCSFLATRQSFQDCKLYLTTVHNHIRGHARECSSFRCKWGACAHATAEKHPSKRNNLRHIITHIAWYYFCSRCLSFCARPDSRKSQACLRRVCRASDEGLQVRIQEAQQYFGDLDSIPIGSLWEFASKLGEGHPRT